MVVRMESEIPPEQEPESGAHWECRECEYQLNVTHPPEVCPICGETSSFEHRHPVELDAVDRELANLLQNGVPLVETPWELYAAQLGITAEEVMERVRRMKADVIRQISAIFDSRSLGYKSTLVAMQFPPDDIDRGAAVINRHPGVSHNYRRNHPFNLWFTLTIHNSQDLQEEVDRLSAASGALRTILLPTVRLFKIGVKLDVTGKKEVTRQEEGPVISGIRADQQLTREEIEAVRVLQRDLPIEARPFRVWEERFGIPQEQLFVFAQSFLERGIMRRFSAVLRHRNAGFSANAMGVWIVPEARLEEVGQTIAGFAAVSHCYQRPTYPDWPYNLFSMVHGKTTEDCDAVLDAIAARTGLRDYAKLYSTKEYKKVRVKYFPPGMPLPV
ncbi:MAG: AsnC family transcriptional regulator [Chloroherpetonaceae bacterium]|nr:AsnC family transcriptional regulator [Chthonomonadaceae bacterium]MDW8207742.1 AsnC family transcriptional regulator [Chloroherpetonaceae bacterium]